MTDQKEYIGLVTRGVLFVSFNFDSDTTEMSSNMTAKNENKATKNKRDYNRKKRKE